MEATLARPAKGPAIDKIQPRVRGRSFAIEPLEERIAPDALLNLNLNVLVQDVQIAIKHVNVVVSGDVVQVGILGGQQTGNVTSFVSAS